ncbi:MAG TPA: PIN domain-containing protein [Gaiellaceae bacterium]|nr:PIN domain-containing protein [Gaiellaceae bacterium]
MIFVDSSFWIGLSDELDERHEDAAELLRAHNGKPLVTSNHVVGETWTFLRKRHRHAVAMKFLDRAESAERLDIAFVSPALEREGWAWLRRRDEREYSFVDATSFALMRSLRIREAFAFDGDFAAAGFVELRP